MFRWHTLLSVEKTAAVREASGWGARGMQEARVQVPEWGNPMRSCRFGCCSISRDLFPETEVAPQKMSECHRPGYELSAVHLLRHSSHRTARLLAERGETKFSLKLITCPFYVSH